MSNPLEVVGHDLKVAAIKTEHAVAKAVDFLPHAAALLAAAIKDLPEVRTAVTELVAKAQVVIADSVTDVAGKGLNLAEDAQTIADAEAFFAYFRDSFMPAIEKIYAEITDDIR